MLNMNYWISID